jgi:tRNA(His) guanylyltransferase
MLFTLTTTHRPATDLGYLLHKNPARCQSFPLSFGQAHVFYPEANEDRCTAALVLDVDSVALVRGQGGVARTALAQYVNDRPYVASSLMSVAISQVFGPALDGRSKERPELAGTSIPLSATLEVLPCRGGENLLHEIFQPLGYHVDAIRYPLDESFEEWGQSPYYSVSLAKTTTLSELLSHLYVLIPVFETAHDLCVLPGLYMVARLDGRSFTRLTKEVHQFETPFDARFRDMMLDTAEHLMDCGFNMTYGYTESDEISLLFAHDERGFGRKLRKLNSILAGEASARFSLLLGAIACFDCRICELPTPALVVDYFRWRNEDAHRNALNAHCFWSLRRDGKIAGEATAALAGKSVAEKNELLFQHGINFNDLPSWQKRGCGLYWQEFEKQAVNPVTGEAVTAFRRRIRRDLDLPMKDAYGEFIREFIDEDHS